MDKKSIIQRMARNKSYELNIGEGLDGEKISIPYSSRESHLHVIGRTRSGKSRFLADLIIQDFVNQQGVCLLDPHGELYSYVLAWLARRPHITRRRTIHPIDFADPSHTFCFNPLAINHPDEAYAAAEALTEVLSRVYGNSATDTPLIDSNLNTIFVILAQQGLPLTAALNFIQSDFAAERDRIVGNHRDPYYRALGESFARIRPDSREWHEAMGSTERRLRQFLGRPIMRKFFGQTQNSISFRQAMDEGHVLLFNLKPDKDRILSSRQMRALSMLLTGSMVDAAFTRDERASPKPFYAYLDEVQTMLTDDADRILSECSKFGLFLTASHQYLDQLEIEGSERIKSALMANTLLKAIFATSQQDALEFVDEAFADQIDFQRVKEDLKTPHVLGHRRIRLQSAGSAVAQGKSKAQTIGDSEANAVGASVTRQRGNSTTKSSSGSSSTSDTESHNRSSSDGENYNRGVSYPEDNDEDRVVSEQFGTSSSHSSSLSYSTVTQSGDSWSSTDHSSWSESNTDNTSRTLTDSRSETSGVSQTDTKSAGWSESLEPIISMFSTQTWSLEEQRYNFARTLARSPKRSGHFVAVGHGTMPFVTNDRADLPAAPKAEAKLVHDLRERSDWMIDEEVAIDRAAVFELGEVHLIDEDDEYFE